MPSQRTVGLLALVTLTVIWGTTFPAIKIVVGRVGFLYYVTLRFALASLPLAPVALARRSLLSAYLLPGLQLGVLYFLGITLQGWGMEYTRASNAAFVTGLSVVFVYAFEAFLGKAKPSRRLASAVALALLGLYLMSFSGGAFEVMLGDAIVLAGSVCWALQIMAVDRVARGDLFSLLFLECSFTALAAALIAPLSGLPSGSALGAALPPLAYLATVCTVGANALQLYGQRWVGSVEAAFIYLLEPVFAAVFSYFALGETLTPLQVLGAGAIVSAMALSTMRSGRGN
ncbi:MAG: DMT family transporter [Thermofilaceae archaeon]